MESKAKKSKPPQETVIKQLPEESGMILILSPGRSQDKPSKSGKSSRKYEMSSKVSEDKKGTCTKSRVITKVLVGTPSTPESGVIFKRHEETSRESKTSKDVLLGSGEKSAEATQVSGVSSEGPSDNESVVLFKRPKDIPSVSSDKVRMQSVVVFPSGSGERPKSVVVTPGTNLLKPRSVVVSPGGSRVKPKSVVVATGNPLLKPRSVVVSPGGSGTKPQSVVVTPGIKHKTYVVTAGMSGIKSACFPIASGSGVRASDAKASGDQASGSVIQALGSELEDSGPKETSLGLKDTDKKFHTSEDVKQTAKAIKRQHADEVFYGSNETEKILIVADVQGKFDQFFPKIKKIEKKIEGISFVLCIGDFFGNNSQRKWQAYYEGSKKVPVDTYVLGPVNAKQVEYYPRLESYKNDKFIDLADRVFYLGKLGVFTTKTGLNIAFLSGMESTESTAYSYNDEDVNELVVMLSDPSNNFLPIDIFISNQWPTNIASDCPTQNSSDLLQIVIKALVPRYVFSGTEGLWYKRNPYSNEYPYEFVYTRFIGLGKFDSNQKSIFALELKKEIERLKVKKLDESPFKNIIIYPGHVDFRWDVSAMYEDLQSQNSDNNDDSAVEPSSPFSSSSSSEEEVLEHEARHRCPHMSNKDNCWFCLSSSDFEDHYMLHLGTHSYVARAKGGLLIEHLVIASVNHIKSYSKLSDEAKDEVNNFKIIVRSYYKDKACCPVFFERNFKSSVHFIMDAVPIQLCQSSEVKPLFEEYADKYNLSVKWYPNFNSLDLPKDDKSQYFWAELPNREVLFIPISKNFPAFFGRMVLADPKLLNKSKRINWRHGVRSVEKERKYTEGCRSELATCI